MRIISEFKDYYDIGLQYGIDEKLIYFRNSKEIGLSEDYNELCNSIRNINSKLNSHYRYKNNHRTYVIVFCNIPFIKIENQLQYYEPEEFSNEIIGFINKDRLFIEKFDYTNLTNILNCPVYLLGNYKTSIKDRGNNIAITNIQLKKYEFYKNKDPYTAFQELSMFLGGVLSKNEDKPQITDDIVLRNSKGFDDKSFKQVSPGKKFNRRLK